MYFAAKEDKIEMILREIAKLTVEEQKELLEYCKARRETRNGTDK